MFIKKQTLSPSLPLWPKCSVPFFMCSVNMKGSLETNIHLFIVTLDHSRWWYSVCVSVSECVCVLSLLLMSNSVCLQNADKSQVEDSSLLHTHTNTYKCTHTQRVLTISYLATTMSPLICKARGRDTHTKDAHLHFTHTVLTLQTDVFTLGALLRSIKLNVAVYHNQTLVQRVIAKLCPQLVSVTWQWQNK